MSTTIASTSSTDKTSPLHMLGYQASREAQNIFHDILGGGQDVTLRPAALRSGVLRLLYASEPAAAAALAMLARQAVFTVADTDVASVSMRFAVSGTVAIEQDDDRALWLVSVGYREVTA